MVRSPLNFVGTGTVFGPLAEHHFTGTTKAEGGAGDPISVIPGHREAMSPES
jgi:hypothetical protein